MSTLGSRLVVATEDMGSSYHGGQDQESSWPGTPVWHFRDIGTSPSSARVADAPSTRPPTGTARESAVLHGHSTAKLGEIGAKTDAQGADEVRFAQHDPLPVHPAQLCVTVGYETVGASNCSPRFLATRPPRLPPTTHTLRRTFLEPRRMTWWWRIFPNRPGPWYHFAVLVVRLGKEWENPPSQQHSRI